LLFLMHFYHVDNTSAQVIIRLQAGPTVCIPRL
jgi:hypothetical protein